MQTYYCKRDCFFRDKLWKKGDSVVASEADKLPRHFTVKEVFKKVREEDKSLAGALKKPRDFVDYIRSQPREDFSDEEDDDVALQKEAPNKQAKR